MDSAWCKPVFAAATQENEMFEKGTSEALERHRPEPTGLQVEGGHKAATAVLPSAAQVYSLRRY